MKKINKTNASLALIPLLSLTGCHQKENRKPNIIVILADDLGYGDVSAYGAKTIHTPQIDRFAQEGVCFTNGYATSATSTPSRYALMTGMYPWKNKDAKILPGDAPLIISEDQYTLPKMMQQAGYTTGAIGKWHLGMGSGNVNWNTKVSPGANQIGFDYSCLIAATNDRVPTVYVENGYVVGLDPDDPIAIDYDKNFEGEPTALSNPEMLKMQWAHGHNNSIVNGIPRIGFMKGGQSARWIDEDMADYFVGKVKSFLTENKEKPFFLYYGLHQPHVPRAPHSRFVGKSGMGPRGDAIIEADWCVGELYATLESLGLLENTIIIFSSDNGPVLNDGYKDDAVELLGQHKPTGGLRGGKYSLYDGGTRVPFFVYWKDHIRPSKSDALICQLDLMPSFAKLAGITIEQKIDGQPLLDVLTGQQMEGRKDLVVEASGRLAYRKGNWIMIPPYEGSVRNLTGNELGNLTDYGLFNLEKDPWQQQNIAKDNPEILQAMITEFLQKTEGFYNPEVKEEVLK